MDISISSVSHRQPTRSDPFLYPSPSVTFFNRLVPFLDDNSLRNCAPTCKGFYLPTPTLLKARKFEKAIKIQELKNTKKLNKVEKEHDLLKRNAKYLEWCKQNKITPQNPVDNLISNVNILSIVASFTKVSKRVDKMIRCNLGFVNQQNHVPFLEEAHGLTQSLYGILTFSLLNKTLCKNFELKREDLLKKIFNLVQQVHESYRGSKCLRECVDSGWYLSTLRIYFYYKPSALVNYATDSFKEEGFKRTILHNAVAPNNYTVSLSFVTFLFEMNAQLEMNPQHNLGLLTRVDCYNKTPLQNYIDYSRFQDRKKKIVKIKDLFLKYDPSSKEAFEKAEQEKEAKKQEELDDAKRPETQKHDLLNNLNSFYMDPFDPSSLGMRANNNPPFLLGPSNNFPDVVVPYQPPILPPVNPPKLNLPDEMRFSLPPPYSIEFSNRGCLSELLDRIFAIYIAILSRVYQLFT